MNSTCVLKQLPFYLLKRPILPYRQHEKDRVIGSYRDIERYLKDSGESIDRDLLPDNLDRTWNQLMMVYEERDHIIREEIARYPCLLRLPRLGHLVASYILEACYSELLF